MTLAKVFETSKTAYRRDGDFILAYSEAKPDEISKFSRGPSGTGTFQTLKADRTELEAYKDWTSAKP